MRANATQAAIVLLGLAIAANPSWSHPGLSIATMAMGQSGQAGQAEAASPRRQTEELLRRARVAMKDGNVELAERFVSQAEKLNVTYKGLLSQFVDTPKKARQDLDRLKSSGRKSDGLRLPNLFGKKAEASQSAATSGDLSEPQRLPDEVTQGGVAFGEISNPYLGGDYPNTGQTGILGDTASPSAAADGATTLPKEQQQARRLVAQARAALDRGDLSEAENLARQASQLRAPEKAFDGGDTPWELMLHVNKQRRLQGVAQAGSQDGPGNVAQAVYDPDQDPSFVRAASAEQPLLPPANMMAQQGIPGLRPLPEQPAPVDAPTIALTPESATAERPATDSALPGPPGGQLVSPEASGALDTTVGATASGRAPEDLIELGEAALQQRNLDEARDYFRQAWTFEGELDQATRQRLQDHLMLLRANVASPPTADSAQQQEQLRIRRFVSEVSREQADIARELRVNPKDAWQRMKQLRSRVQEADLPDVARGPLVNRLDRAVEETERFIEQNRAQIELDEHNRDVLDAIDRERSLRAEVRQKLVGMVDDFNELMDQQRYQEAFILAKQARDLDPQNPVVENMIWKSRFAERMFVELSLRDRQALGMESALDSVVESSIGFDDRNPIQFPKKWDVLSDIRKGFLADRRSRYTEVEQEIQRALRKKVQVQFDEQPLSTVISTLGNMTGINVHLDTQGLAAEGVTSDTPISINLMQEISLQSVLNLVLEPLRLGYVIQDEVLRITSEQARAGDVYVYTYYVGDLVIPIPNFMPGYQNGMAGALAQAHAALGYGQGWAGAQAPPLAVLANNSSEQLGSQSSVLAQMSASDLLPNGSSGPQPLGFGPGGLGGATQADFDTLMELISSTVAPDTWDDVGGPGSMAPFEGNLSLVISNTQEVHEEIVELLEQLRRLQDLQVTIEVRFITLQDNFFERIGVDFDFDVRDGTGLVQQDIIDAAGNGTDEDLDITIGLDPTGNPTLDLDLSFNQNSFASAVPAFGGFDPAAASTFGFAILSDIEAFFVMEAIQGDQRTNVMQAPKITLFNGQFANINDTSSRPFVTSVIPVVGDFAVAQQPVILVLAEGTQLNVQAVVSNDRRFVRLTLLPMFSQIGDVDTFTFEGRRSSDTGSTTEVDPNDETTTTTENNDQFTEGTTVQLPTFAQTSVSTTVSVPDGGTVLLGGIKRLAEGRNERGMPILGKLPYVSRLFKNVGIGRETQTLMMMVTPRIIIQEEEEERVLGTPAP